MNMVGQANARMVAFWKRVGMRFMPFADVATAEMPFSRLLRLALFQVSVGMAAVLLTGTLNRVMIVELGVSTSLVAIMVAIPVVAAPFRALIGHKSDTYRSFLGWRRVPYIWFGTLLQFGGLAILPFALLLLQSQNNGPEWAGSAGAALAFLLVGLGMHMTQTAGLALATDLVPEDKRPRVVALTYVVFLIGMIGSAFVLSYLLNDFSAKRLIQVIQGAAVLTLGLNVISLWKQEARDPSRTAHSRESLSFREAIANYRADPRTTRLLVALALGTAAFSMQDVLLEPYGAEVLGLTVSQTTMLTALWAAGTLTGFLLAGHLLAKGFEMHRVAAIGALSGIVAFSAVVFAAPLEAPNLFRAGAAVIGFGGGLFAVGTMLAAMELGEHTDHGLAIGAWGAVQATSIGIALAVGGVLRDVVNSLAMSGTLGATLNDVTVGYSVVYHIEIMMLFASLVVLGPLTYRRRHSAATQRQFGLAELPG
ncbi:BCD family MFS transporter [Rhodobium gokarnense]|uniref:BCD family chlorophyll transporter-like MFS transporter n=1 Tax=Rhodobium gokarnense TaxID=364296 RepID=A0ABT3HBR9_9HYPH|nr:BCD family chlorophyll transporter-like MFS transporter [Rhodobium gokarnense]